MIQKLVISVFDRVENIVGKGEIACASNFSFSPQCFQKASFPEVLKGVIVWKWVNPTVAATVISLWSVRCLFVSWLSHTSPDTNVLSKEPMTTFLTCKRGETRKIVRNNVCSNCDEFCQLKTLMSKIVSSDNPLPMTTFYM